MTLTDDAIERFENTAAAFYRATGVMAPGKDVPAAIGGYDEQDLRRKLFDQWCDAEMLRAELDAWKNAAHEGHPNPCTLGPLCPYCEIEQLEQALSAMRDKLTETVIEKDKRIAELQDVGTKSIVDLQRAEKRIAELEAAKRTYIAPHGYVFAGGQINAAWKTATRPITEESRRAGWIAREAMMSVLKDLGIVACEKCGGTKVIRNQVINGVLVIDPACDCPNNGWKIEVSDE